MPYFCSRYNKPTHMRHWFILLMLAVMAPAVAQDSVVVVDDDFVLPEGETPLDPDMKLTRLVFYRYKTPDIIDGDTMWTYLMPELPVYRPKVFKSERERRRYTRLIYNVKRVLPLARKANMMLQETYEVLETLPTKREKDEHIKAVERDIRKQYTPEMKKLTFSQGKLLIKLVDRECNQTSFEIVKAFLGPFRAGFYQVFAWTFKASLKKHYDPEGDDAEIERIVRQIEAGQL